MGRKRIYKNAAERQKAYRERKKLSEKRKKLEAIESKIREQGYENIHEFLVAVHEGEIRKGVKSMEEVKEGGVKRTEIMRIEADFRKATGLSGVYRTVDSLKNEARQSGKMRATFFEFKAYDERQVWLVMVYPDGRVRWREIESMREKLNEEQPEIPGEILAKFRGAKGIKPAGDITEQLKQYVR
ncbi:MAG: hypothetical protein DRN81_06610 [Thermoproteota archaeon]|nr:MAG: hypothetical protein DRN81_06610 [Candidatus Korarchaeota archaeon]